MTSLLHHDSPGVCILALQEIKAVLTVDSNKLLIVLHRNSMRGGTSDRIKHSTQFDDDDEEKYMVHNGSDVGARAPQMVSLSFLMRSFGTRLALVWCSVNACSALVRRSFCAR